MHVFHEFSQNIKCFSVNSKLFLTHCSFKTLANIVVATLALPQRYGHEACKLQGCTTSCKWVGTICLKSVTILTED